MESLLRQVFIGVWHSKNTCDIEKNPSNNIVSLPETKLNKNNPRIEIPSEYSSKFPQDM